MYKGVRAVTLLIALLYVVQKYPNTKEAEKHYRRTNKRNFSFS